jgi:MFS family permease
VTQPAADATGERPGVSGHAATMTVVAIGLGYSITAADPTILSATGSGRAAQRFGDRVVLVTGLLLLLAGLLMLTVVEKHTSLVLFFLAVALNAVGGAVVQTPQSTIMMSAAPPDLGGSVSAVKTAIGQSGYSLGPALFALVGTALFAHNATSKIAGTDLTLEQARDALRAAHGTSVSSTGGVNVVDWSTRSTPSA